MINKFWKNTISKMQNDVGAFLRSIFKNAILENKL